LPKRKPRKARPKEKGVPKGYDSKWEYELHKNILKSWNHHTSKVPYVVEHNYEPDFERDKILIEAKGRFWDHAEYSKYLWIRKALPSTVELVFIFQKPYAPMPGAKKRKDGTKRTHAEWAESNNFKWFSEDNLPEDFE
tara:strand:- start:188 stop:601 length:414 start_codon:yes stop_codon:yes gene_type:complete